MNPTSFATVATLLLTSSLAGYFLQSPPQTGKGSPRINSDKRSDADPEKAAASELTSRRLLAIDLIKAAGEEAVRIENKKSAAQIQLLAAEMLGPHDKEIARDLFRAAFDSALAYYRAARDEQRDPVTRLTTTSPEDFCRDVIRRTSAFDAGLGRRASDTFDKELKNNSGRQNRSADVRSESVIGDQARSNEMVKASLMLRRDQKGAVELAKKIFSGGFYWQEQDFIWQLAKQDRDAADEFFLWLLANLLEDKTASPWQLQMLAFYPFVNKFHVLSDGHNIVGPGYIVKWIVEARHPGSEQILIDWFIEVAYTVLSRTAWEDLSVYPDAPRRIGAAAYLAQRLEPHVAGTRPALLPAWHELTERLAHRLSPERAATIARMPERETKLIEDLNLKSRLEPEDSVTRIKRWMEAAGNERDQGRADYLYHTAAVEADRIGDRPWALEIVDRIASLEFRTQTRDWILFNASSQALKDGRLEAARRDAAEVSAPDQRASLYCALARAALRDKDKIGAAMFLDEVETRTVDAANSPAKVRALVMIANLFGRFDAYRAAQVVSLAVRTANNTPDYEPDDARMVRSLKHAAGRKYGLVHQAEKADLVAAIASIAPSDFEGALQLAQSIANKPLRLSATISVAATGLQTNTGNKAKDGRKENAEHTE